MSAPLLSAVPALILPSAACVHARAPKIYQYLLRTKEQLQADKKLSALKWNFSGSVFPMMTVNLGPQTVTLPHRDHANLAAAFCVITAMGKFDPEQGGQLVLWELGLVIDFPAGSSIAIPSALITHFNTAVGDLEDRMSITQYCSGHLCRFVDNLMRTDKQCKADRDWDRVKAERRPVSEWVKMFPQVVLAGDSNVASGGA